MLTYKLHRDPYDCENLFSGKLERQIDPGLTVLVGCNGSGKSTILHYIKERYARHPEYKIFTWDGLTDKRYAKDRSLHMQNFSLLSSLAFSSEGEEININIGIMAGQIGNFVKRNVDKDIIILIDGLDSGLSIDYIIETKDFFKNLVIPDVENNGHKCYVIVSANEYELASGERCVDARTGKKMSFQDYSEYKKFILKSRKAKDNRTRKD